MRLLNVDSLQLEEFFNDIPEYTILSHTWGDGEVLFKDIENGTADQKPAWSSKVKRCCEQTAADGFHYTWIDTLSIDKTNLVELSEAINSMFRWYEQASICYVFLSDYTSEKIRPKKLAKCRWWLRGWTLQELLAPEFVVFYNSKWKEIGSRTSLKSEISTITEISGIHLEDFKGCTLATKMSWASKRSTTLKEDEAYCLLGIFGLYMPLLYGEGANAFYRLQLELVKLYSDQSILAWNGFNCNGQLFADSPRAFDKGASWSLLYPTPKNSVFEMTNRGLMLTAALRKDEDASQMFRAVLACGDNVRDRCVLRLEHCPDGTYSRVGHSERFTMFDLDVGEEYETICIRHTIAERWPRLTLSNYRVTVNCLPEVSMAWMTTVDTTKTDSWKPPLTDPINTSQSVGATKEVFVRSGFFLALELVVEHASSKAVNFGLAIKRCKDTITLIGWRCDHVSTSRTVINGLRGFKPPPSQKRDSVYLPLSEGLNFKAVLRPSGFKTSLSVPVMINRVDAFTLSLGFQQAASDDSAQEYFGPHPESYDEPSARRLVDGIRIY